MQYNIKGRLSDTFRILRSHNFSLFVLVLLRHIFHQTRHDFFNLIKRLESQPKVNFHDIKDHLPENALPKIIDIFNKIGDTKKLLYIITTCEHYDQNSKAFNVIYDKIIKGPDKKLYKQVNVRHFYRFYCESAYAFIERCKQKQPHNLDLLKKTLNKFFIDNFGKTIENDTDDVTHFYERSSVDYGYNESTAEGYWDNITKNYEGD